MPAVHYARTFVILCFEEGNALNGLSVAGPSTDALVWVPYRDGKVAQKPHRPEPRKDGLNIVLPDG